MIRGNIFREWCEDDYWVSNYFFRFFYVFECNLGNLIMMYFNKFNIYIIDIINY